MNEQLTPEEKMTLEAYDANARQWSEKHSTAGFWRDEMQKFKTLLPTGKILEIGSGGGRDARELIALGYDYIGTDISTGLIEIAKEQNPGATFLVQSVYNLHFPAETFFDGFWASTVLLHIPKMKIDAALQQIRKYLKNGAVGFIALKQGEGEKMKERIADDGSRYRRFFAYYSAEEFGDILRRNKFEIVQTKTRPMSEKTTFLCFFVKP